MASPDYKKIYEEIMAEDLRDLAPAQESAQKQASIANWGRVANNIAGAFGGFKPDHTVYDNIEQRGRQGVADATGRLGLKKAAMGEARALHGAQVTAQKEAEENDGNSEYSKAQVDFARRVTKRPDLFPDGMSARQVAKVQPWLKEMFDSDRAERARAEKLGDRTEDRTHQAQRDARLHGYRMNEAAVAAGGKAAAAVEAGAEKVGKDLEDAAGAVNDLGILTKATKTTKKDIFGNQDISGAGLFDGMKPDIMDSLEDTQTRQAALRMIQRITKAQSGTGVSVKEAEQIAKARGLIGGTEQSFRVGLDSLLTEWQTVSKSKEAKHNPKAVQTYKERGGVVSADLPKPGESASFEEFEVIGPNGEEGTAAELTPEDEAAGWRRK